MVPSSGYNDSIYEIDRGLNNDDDFTGPVKSSSRKMTDVTFLIIKIAFVIGLFGLVGYCMANGDLNRLFNGYDNCGNVCGQINTPSKEPGFCKGGDFTDKKYLLYDLKDSTTDFDVRFTRRQCVTSCLFYPSFVQVGNKCFPTSVYLANQDIGNFFQNEAEDMGNMWPYLIYLFLTAFALSMFFLLMFRYATTVMVWMSLILMMVLTIGWTIYLWIQPSTSDNSQNGGAIFMTLITVIAILVILVAMFQVRIVIQLFEEAARAITAMPLILIQPIWTFLALSVTGSLWFYFSIYIQSAGILTPINDKIPEFGFFYYRRNAAMEVTRWYNLFAVCWMSQIVISCQHLVVASAVSTWYFSRDKSRLGSPLLTGFKNLVRYHLGSVILASLIMATVAVIRFLLKLAEKTFTPTRFSALSTLCYYCSKCILNCGERIFNVISRNAYVEIVIYGKGFCPSAVRGLKMIFNNVFSAAAINSIGDFVLLTTKHLVVIIIFIISTFLFENSVKIHYPWIPILLCILCSFFIAHIFISVFDMTIDTIFICFCEDCEMNDGINKPYFMNRGLMEFVENSKKILKIKNNKNTKPSAPPK